MKTATYIKAMRTFKGDAALYRLSEPVPYGYAEDGRRTTEHVIVSAVDALFSGPETFIFPATEAGEVASWHEMDGSYRGGFSHAEALNGLGFIIA